MKGEIFSFLPLRLCSFASLRETKLRSVTPIPPQSVTVIKEYSGLSQTRKPDS